MAETKSTTPEIEKRTLTNLCHDCQQLILDYVPSPNDLLAFGLTSRQCLDLALPRLYKVVFLTEETKGYPFEFG